MSHTCSTHTCAHTQEIKLLADEEVLVPLRRRLHLDLERAQTSFEDDLDDLREKYLHKNVQKVFDDADAPTGERTCRGTVEDIDWSARDGCYLFRIRYEEDGDEEDMESWEVKNHLVALV